MVVVAVGVARHADKPRAREKRRSTIESWVTAHTQPKWDELRAAAASLRTGEQPLWPFHWAIEFPEVFARENPGFNAVVGNPPFLGGLRVRVPVLRGRRVTPHVAVNAHRTRTGKRRRTAVDGRTTRHAGYDVSQRCRKRIEEAFGWIKAAAGFAQTKFRGTERVDAAFTLATAAYNLVRLPKLLVAPS